MFSGKISGINYECIPLKWDTEYFGINSARVNLLGAVNDTEQRQIKEFCQAYDFVTIANIYNRKENNHWIGKSTNAFLTDVNIQFTKKISDKADFLDRTITIVNTYEGDNKILDIAGEAFRYSRFFNDPMLPSSIARNIYKHWSEAAFNKEDKYFAVCIKNNEIAGYVLFSLNNDEDNGCIELIAVDEKFRGQKVGSSLLNATEAYIAKHNLSQIKVGTQADNIAAMQLYVSYGFRYSYCSSIYHLWR